MWFDSILEASGIQNSKEIHNGISGVTFTEQKFAINQKYKSIEVLGFVLFSLFESKILKSVDHIM